jgi:tetratricopeptide (TPR) repeat protein
MSRQSPLFIRLAVLATTVVGLVLVTTERATAQHPRGHTGGAPGSGYEIPPPVEPNVTDNSDWTLQWVLLAAAVLGALAVVAIVTEALSRRRWRQPPLETALESSEPDELPRAAGLLGNLLAQQSHTVAAEHAYRAAIDIGDDYWSPIAQVALADLLSEQGQRTEAQTLLEAAIASGHPRAVAAAQTSLHQLWTDKTGPGPASRPADTYERLG